MPTKGQLDAYTLSLMQAEMSKACLVEALIELGTPGTFLDIGCGPGHLVQYAAAALGANALGIDVCLPKKEQIFHYPEGGSARLLQWDLANYVEFERADMVICWEVAEHLPRRLAGPLCKILAESTQEYLLFTAAIPGQGGAGHLNEQPQEYWREKILSHGQGNLIYLSDVTFILSQRMLQRAPAAPWYGNNLQIFRRN